MKSVFHPHAETAVASNGLQCYAETVRYPRHPTRIYTYNEDVTILQVGHSELNFNHSPGVFSIWWQNGKRNVRLWPR